MWRHTIDRIDWGNNVNTLLKKNRTTIRRCIIALLAIAAAVRITAAMLLQLPVCSDAFDYSAIAQSLATGSGFSLSGVPTAFRTPGYPFFLAALYATFGFSPIPVLLVQALIDTLSCFLVFLIGRKLFSLRVALFALCFMSVMPGIVLYVPQLMTETLSLFLGLLFTWHMVSGPEVPSRSRNVVGGIIIGIGVLVRPTLLVLPIAVAAARFWNGWTKRRALDSLFTSLVISLIVVAPWVARNYSEFGRLTLTSNIGLNFWIGAHTGAGGGFSYPKGIDPFMAATSEFDRSDRALSSAIDFVRGSPLEYVLISCKKISHLFALDYWTLALLAQTKEHFSWTWAAGIHIPFMLMVFLAGAGFCFGKAKDVRALRLLIAVIVAWIAIHMVFYGGARYRMPMEPFLIIAGSYGATLFATRSYVVTRRRTIAFILLSLLFLTSWGVELYMNIATA